MADITNSESGEEVPLNTSVKVNNPGKLIWKKEQEDILKVWADKALCYKTMHDKATKKYWCLNAWFNIPVIILSTLTGTGNFAQGSFNPAYAGYLVLALGAANIFSAILGTISQYIGVAGTLEGHRFAAISWDKYARGIQVELGKVRSDRQDPVPYLKRCQEEFDRLIEISPDFSNDIIEWFNKLIETGEYQENNQCCLCGYEWCCLPCGFRGCKKCNLNCCGEKKEDEKKKQFKSEWDAIELPEILGKIKPTKVVREDGIKEDEDKYKINYNEDDIDV
jgi:hypothetical protein